MKQHEKLYKDGDLLNAQEVSDVWFENSGKRVKPRNISIIARRNDVAAKKYGNANGYPYKQIKDVVPAQKGRGAVVDHPPESPAQRMARSRARRRASSAGPGDNAGAGSGSAQHGNRGDEKPGGLVPAACGE